MGILPKKKTAPPQEAAAEKPTGAFEKQTTPYGGSLDGVPVETAPHLIVSGPTGRGKSLRVLVPGALMWAGPRVIVSSKTDFLKKCAEYGIHKRGRLYIMDLVGEVDDDARWLQNIDYTKVISDPCALIENDDDALMMASLLIQVGELGAGGSGGGSDNSAFWETQARQSLAALLIAGKKSGGGIDWAQRAAGAHKSDGTDTAPSWDNAYALIHDKSRHAMDLRNKAATDAKLRDGIKATMANAFSPWLLSTVSGVGREETLTPFSPKMLEGDDEPTLAIIASSDGAGTGAAVAVVEMIIRHWRRGIERGLKRVLLSIDEFANTCPLPKASAYLSEARGLGVAMVLALQSTNAQLKEKYGEAKAESIREVAPAVLILQGDPGSRELLENAAWWDGEEERWTEAIDHQGHKSLSAQTVQRTTAQSLLPRNLEEGRLLLYGQKGHMVELPGIWTF